MSLAELEKEVQKLPPGELAAFTRWFEKFAADQWDGQFERDAATGKLRRSVAGPTLSLKPASAPSCEAFCFA